jgi:type IV secretory pathway TrbD component
MLGKLAYYGSIVLLDAFLSPALFVLSVRDAGRCTDGDEREEVLLLGGLTLLLAFLFSALLYIISPYGVLLWCVLNTFGAVFLWDVSLCNDAEVLLGRRVRA